MIRAVSAVLPESLEMDYTCAARGASSPRADHRQRTILHEGADMQFLRQCSPLTESRKVSTYRRPSRQEASKSRYRSTRCQPIDLSCLVVIRGVYPTKRRNKRTPASECKRLTITFKGWSFRPMTLPRALGAGASSTCATSSIG